MHLQVIKKAEFGDTCTRTAYMIGLCALTPNTPMIELTYSLLYI